ncbi:CDP-glycerol glycerophosphotransferase [Lutimaribacter pacificus]|uniref:Glycosyl transferases group 1 n=2 Tax=Lutimaribacter pacificus TaxID=391948 RepID=A0A1H0GC49_9RHOB|nr:CDP-glycerol glycerophosphotransferase [Lutimaribacter pacificus]SHJ86821.1 Glycosyl transferases group 1 [Lutimaribacter pacificus]
MPGAEFAPCPWVAKMHELRSVNPNAKIFINAARISVEKNHRRLLRAFSILKNQNPNAFLFVLGDGPELEKVKRYAENIGLEDSCFFAGFVHKPAAAIKEADAFVLSSDYEGQPLVLLESLALGTPCVATNHPSMAYVIGDGLGVLTEKDDKALADGMAQVISEGYKPKRFDAKAYNDAALNEFYNLIGVETP